MLARPSLLRRVRPPSRGLLRRLIFEALFHKLTETWARAHGAHEPTIRNLSYHGSLCKPRVLQLM